MASMTLDQIIDALGGTDEVAAECDCGPPALSNWKARGIPKARWVDLVTMAKRKGVKLSLDDVAAAHQEIQKAQRDAA